MSADPLGWGWPAASRTAHIFDGVRSMCGGWLYTGKLDPFIATDRPGPDDCRACMRHALARVKAAERAEKEKVNRG